MAEEILIDAQIRQETGKNANRRLRSEGMIPCILYGVTKENISLSVKPRDIELILRSKKGSNTIFHINMVGERTTRSSVMIKDYQIDPVRDELTHVDFVRINLDEKIETTVPVHVIGKAKGIVEEGGVMQWVLRSLHIECFPMDIPDSIDIDVTEFMIGDGHRVEDLDLGDNITILDDESLLIVQVVPPRKVEVLEAILEGEGEEEELEGEELEEGAEEAGEEGEEGAEEKPEE